MIGVQSESIHGARTERVEPNGRLANEIGRLPHLGRIPFKGRELGLNSKTKRRRPTERPNVVRGSDAGGDRRQ